MGASYCLWKWIDRQLQTITVYREWKPLEQGTGKNKLTVIDKFLEVVWTSLSIKNSWGPNHKRPTNFHKFFFQNLYQVLLLLLLLLPIFILSIYLWLCWVFIAAKLCLKVKKKIETVPAKTKGMCCQWTYLAKNIKRYSLERRKMV